MQETTVPEDIYGNTCLPFGITLGNWWFRIGNSDNIMKKDPLSFNARLLILETTVLTSPIRLKFLLQKVSEFSS